MGTTSNIEVKFEASEYVLAKHEPDEPPSPDTESVTINIKRKKRGGRPRLYPGKSVQERNRARYNAWHALQREKFPEKVKLQNKRALLKIKKKRSQDPEFDAQVRAHQAERKRICRARQKAAQQLALLEG